MLNVKGIGYILHHNLFLNENSTKLDPSSPHLIDFGDIYFGESKSKMIEI